MADIKTPCGECGMPCAPSEFHPFAACLMFKASHSSEVVCANLDALAEAHQAEVARLTRENEGLAKDAAASLPHALSALKAEALEIFDGPETAQDVRDVIEWYSASIDVAMGHARRRIDAALAGASGAQEGERT